MCGLVSFDRWYETKIRPLLIHVFNPNAWIVMHDFATSRTSRTAERERGLVEYRQPSGGLAWRVVSMLPTHRAGYLRDTAGRLDPLLVAPESRFSLLLFYLETTRLRDRITGTDSTHRRESFVETVKTRPRSLSHDSGDFSGVDERPRAK